MHMQDHEITLGDSLSSPVQSDYPTILQQPISRRGDDDINSSRSNSPTRILTLNEEHQSREDIPQHLIGQTFPNNRSNKTSFSNAANSFTNPATMTDMNLANTYMSANDVNGGSQVEALKSDVPPPPKRPLTPYMRFSKFMWQQVKSDNPGLSVCEIGSTIGRMWRELSSEEKQRHNDDFTLDKVRYDGELKQYLKETGLRSRDLVKVRAKNKSTGKGLRRLAHSPPPPFFKTRNQSTSVSLEPQGTPNSHFGQSFFPLGASFGMSMGMLPGYPQMWAGQQYPSQQILASMHLAQQQGLYCAGTFYGPSLSPGFNLNSSGHQ